MKAIIIFFVLALAVNLQLGSAGQCDRNEVFLECGTACEPTCEKQIIDICTMQCIVNVCQCRKNYVRNSKKECILSHQCPPKNSDTTPRPQKDN